MQKLKENLRQKKVEKLIYRPINDRECLKDISNMEQNIVSWGETVKVGVKYIGRYPRTYQEVQNTSQQHRYSNLEWKMKQVVEVDNVREGLLKVNIGRIVFEADNGRTIEYNVRNISHVERHMETNIFAICVHNLVYNNNDYDIFVTSDPKNYSGRRIHELLSFTVQLNRPKPKEPTEHEKLFEKIPEKKVVEEKVEVKVVKEDFKSKELNEGSNSLIDLDITGSFTDLSIKSISSEKSQNNSFNKNESSTSGMSRQPATQHTLIPPPRIPRRQSLFTTQQNYPDLNQPVLSQSFQPFRQSRPMSQYVQQNSQASQVFNQASDQFTNQNTQFPSLNISFTQINQPKVLKPPSVNQPTGTSASNYTFENSFAPNLLSNSSPTPVLYKPENPLFSRSFAAKEQPEEEKAFNWLDSLIKENYAKK